MTFGQTLRHDLRCGNRYLESEEPFWLGKFQIRLFVFDFRLLWVFESGQDNIMTMMSCLGKKRCFLKKNNIVMLFEEGFHKDFTNTTA